MPDEPDENGTEEEDLLAITSRIEGVQMAKLMATQGDYDRALAILGNVRERYDEGSSMLRTVDALIEEYTRERDAGRDASS